jgi:ribosomal protein L32
MRWSGDKLASSAGVRGACEIGVFKRSHHVCMSELQLFDMT